MKVLISCDEYCYSQNGLYYLSDTGLILLKRYLNVFEQVVLALRTKKLSKSEGRGKYRNVIDTSNVHIVPIPFFQGLQQFIPLYPQIWKSVLQILKEHCDLAILRLPSTSAFVVWRTVIRKTNMPYATEIVFDCYDGYLNANTILHKMLWKIMHKWQVVACNKAIGVSCVTQFYLQKHYFPLSEKSVTSHYSSIELPFSFYYKPRTYPDKSDFTIVHVANQVEFAGRKGHNELLEVVSLVRKKGHDVRIIFIGGDYNNGVAKLKSLASDLHILEVVNFAGYLSQTEMRKKMLDADIAILPTRAEGLPRVIIEAMALGLPCITSPVSGNPELISKDLLVNYWDVITMAEKVIALMTDRSYYESVSKGNFEKSKLYESGILNVRRTKFYEELKMKILKTK